VQAKPEERSLLVLIGTDRGLCGSINTNLFKHTNMECPSGTLTTYNNSQSKK
jgi:F0F1-type ATP synthase gamma subunit